MSDRSEFDRFVNERFAREHDVRPPDSAVDQILSQAGRARPLPRWLAFIKEPSMRYSTSIAVGSPTVRSVAVLGATLLLMLVVAGAGIAGSRILAAGPIVVDQSGGGDHETITEALAVASDGDHILVRPGTYRESLAITDDVTLSGDGAVDAIIIEFDADSPTAESDLDEDDVPVRLPYAIRLDDSDAVISGFTIRGPSDGFGIRLSGGAPTIDDVHIELEPATGEDADGNAPLWFGDGAQASVINSSWNGYVGIRQSSPTIEDNTIGGYISIDGPDSAIIRDNHFVENAGVGMSFGGSTIIEGNEFDNGETSADTGADPIIRGNVFHRSRTPGCFNCSAIRIEQGSFDPSAEEDDDEFWESFEPGDITSIVALIEDNRIADAANAIYVSGNAVATIRDNEITDADLAMDLRSSELELDGNTITGGKTGIVVNRGEPVLTGNTVRGVSGRGIVLGGLSDATFVGNTSCGNGTNVWQPDDAAPFPEDENEICADDA